MGSAREHESVSLELEALRKEKRSIEECLDAMSQDLKSKQEELRASVVGYWLASIHLLHRLFSIFNKVKH